MQLTMNLKTNITLQCLQSQIKATRCRYATWQYTQENKFTSKDFKNILVCNGIKSKHKIIQIFDNTSYLQHY